MTGIFVQAGSGNTGNLFPFSNFQFGVSLNLIYVFFEGTCVNCRQLLRKTEQDDKNQESEVSFKMANLTLV